MAKVIFSVGNDTPNGVRYAYSNVTARQAKRRVDGSVLVMRSTLAAQVDGEALALDLPATGKGEAWIISVVDSLGDAVTGYFKVPDETVFFHELVEVDPSSMEPTAKPEPEWWAMAESTVVSGTVDAKGDLILEQHNGAKRNAGHVVGKDGKPGKDGAPGRDGAKGEKGDKGDKGDRGIQGEKGVEGESNLTFENGFNLKTINRAEHSLVRIFNADKNKMSIEHLTGNNSMSPTAEFEEISSFYRRTGANIITNASGWWTESGRRVGLCILNGTLIQDWEAEGQLDWGIESFVIFNDGHYELCKRSEESGAQLISRGAWNSFTFGRIALENGVSTGLERNPKYAGVTGRSAVGWDSNNNLVLLSFPGRGGDNSFGASIQDVYNTAADNGLTHLYMLDGGGSTQIHINGQQIVSSSDPGYSRAVPDVMAFHAKTSAAYYHHTPWQNLTLASGVVPDGERAYNDFRVIRQNGYIKGRLRLSLTGLSAGKNIATIPREAGYPIHNFSFPVGINGGRQANINVFTSGQISITAADPSWVTPETKVNIEYEYTIS